MSINRGMCKDVVPPYNGRLLSLKDETNATCSNMDGPKVCHTERGETGRQIHIITYMWNLFFKEEDINELTKQK